QDGGALREYRAALTADVERGGRTVTVARLDNREQLLRNRQVLLGDLQARAQRQRLEVGVGNAGGQRGGRRFQIEAAGIERGVGAGRGGRHAAPDVNLVIDLQRSARRFALGPAADGGSARLDATGAGIGADRQQREQRGAGT